MGKDDIAPNEVAPKIMIHIFILHNFAMNSNHTPATLLIDDGPSTSFSANLLPSVSLPLLLSVPHQPDAAPMPPPAPAPALPATPRPLPETLAVLSSPSNSVHSFCSEDTQVIPKDVDIPKDHFSFTAISNGRSKGMLNQTERVKIFKEMISLANEKLFCPSMLLDEKIVKFITDSRSLKKWTNDSIPEHLCHLDLLRKRSLHNQAESRTPKAIKNFDEYMHTAYVCALSNQSTALNARLKVTGPPLLGSVA